MDRLLLDSTRYLAHHMVLAFVVFCAGGLLLNSVFRDRLPVARWMERYGRLAAITAGAGLLVLFVAVGVWYLSVPGFAGEVEPLVSSISWLVQKGQPLYHDVNAPERYSVLYGPSVFLTNGLFLEVFGPTLKTAKLASLAASFLSLIFLYLAVARRKLDGAAAAVAGVAVLYYWVQGFAAYLVRPDSLILFAVAAAILAAARGGRWIAALGVAVMLGFAVNLKIHAGLYFLPMLGMLADRWNARTALAAAAGAVLVILAPFAFYPQISLGNYLQWLDNAAKHGLTAHQLAATLRYGGFLLLPLIVLRLVGPLRGAWLREHRLFLLMLPATAVSILLLSNKPGAGRVHLLPLVPVMLYLAGVAVQRSRSFLLWQSLPHRSAGLVFALVATIVVSGGVTGYQAIRRVDYDTSGQSDMCADIQEIMDEYEGLKIGMACGGEKSNFRKTWLRPLLVFQNNPLFLDPISVMDCCLAGQDLSSETYTALAEGKVDLWLVPRQKAPFVKLNWYPPHSPIFSEKFLMNFHENFTMLGSSRYFDLWFWNGVDGESIEERLRSRQRTDDLALGDSSS